MAAAPDAKARDNQIMRDAFFHRAANPTNGVYRTRGRFPLPFGRARFSVSATFLGVGDLYTWNSNLSML